MGQGASGMWLIPGMLALGFPLVVWGQQLEMWLKV